MKPIEFTKNGEVRTARTRAQAVHLRFAGWTERAPKPPAQPTSTPAPLPPLPVVPLPPQFPPADPELDTTIVER